MLLRHHVVRVNVVVQALQRLPHLLVQHSFRTLTLPDRVLLLVAKDVLALVSPNLFFGHRSRLLDHGWLLSLLFDGVDLSHELGHLGELVVIFHEELPCLVVEGAFGERYDEQTLDDLENVLYAPLPRVPVLLQSVHANLALIRHVRVENLGREEAWRSESLPFGGLAGKSSLMDRVHLNTPPSYGVWTGPVMSAEIEENVSLVMGCSSMPI